jgi:uncharacterized membrane protein
MAFKIKKEDALKYLLIAVFISFTFCFIIKLLAIYNVVPWKIGYSDVNGWHKKAFEPGMPYIDKGVEYPVVIGLVMYAASRFGLNYYFFFHYALLLACTLISTKYLYRLSQKLNTSRKALFIFWALAPSMLWFSYFNWDIIAVMFSILALYYYKEKRDVLATVFLSLGFATKMYPLFILFPVLLHRRFKDWFKLCSVFVGTFLVTNIYFILRNFSKWFWVYSFNTAREPNVDSIWHLIMNLFPNLTIPAVNMITLLLFAFIYLYVNIKFRKKGFIVMSFFSILLFLLTNKVFSPQYLLWLIPFLALIPTGKGTFYGLELSNMFVLFFTLPYLFDDSLTALTWSGIFVVLRHAALAYMFYILLKKKVLVSSSS